MSVELKAKLVEAIITVALYYLPVIVVTLIGFVAWAIPKVIDKIKEYTPDSVDRVLDVVEQKAENFVHDAKNEAEAIANDKTLDSKQKEAALLALRDKQAAKLAQSVKDFTGTKIPMSALIEYAKTAITKAVRFVKRDFSNGNSPVEPK